MNPIEAINSAAGRSDIGQYVEDMLPHYALLFRPDDPFDFVRTKMLADMKWSYNWHSGRALDLHNPAAAPYHQNRADVWLARIRYLEAR